MKSEVFGFAKQRWLTNSVAAFLFAAFFALPVSAKAPSKEPLDVGMRDGVSLKTHLHLPEGDGPWPVILMRTPYPIQMVTGLSPPKRYQDAGYAFVLQSSRGTGESGGDFSPFSHARNDGEDTLNWIADQSFCNGKIGLSGASAMGITANYCASIGHPCVKAAFVMVAPHSSFDEVTFMGGVFKQAQVSQWMTVVKAPEQIEQLRARAAMDDEWRQVDLPQYMPQINVPVYNVGGWYDIFLNGTLTNFQLLQNKGADGARGHQKVRIGAFGHMPIGGDLSYPNGGSMAESAKQDEIRWFDHWVKGVENGIDREPPVEYYLMASARKDAPSDRNRVVRSSTWPPVSESTRYYMRSNLALSKDAPSSSNSASSDSQTSYPFDPKNPVQTLGGANLFLPRGPIDQRQIGQRDDYLRFQSEPLREDVAVVGKIQVELYAATDGPDTDFMVKLVDVYPDGYEALLQDAPIRARFRNGRNPEEVAMMTPGKPEKMTIDLWSTANVFEKGHRIAVHVTSSNHPRFEVNPNTGHQLGGSRKETRVATNTILHSAEYPSAIVLPIVNTEANSDGQ